MKNNRSNISKISGSILVVLLSLLLTLSMLAVDVPAAFATENTQTAQAPETTETPQPTEEPQLTEEPQPTEEPPADTAAEEGESVPEEVQLTSVDGADCIDGEVIVKFKDTVSESAAETVLVAMDSEVRQDLPVEGMIVAEVPEGATVESFIEALEGQPNVEYAQPNFVYSIDRTVNDPYASSQWYLSTIGAYDAWDITMGSAAVRVAVLDTGIDLDHTEFAGQIYAQTDVVSHDGSADDDDGHGTHVAGIIAARADNGTGVAGIAPGVQLIVVDVFDGGGAYTTDIIEGMQYALSHGADVMNMSFGCYQDDTAFRTAINNAVSGGAICIAAAGNEGTAASSYPSDYDSVISVIATNTSDVKTSWSNYGSAKDISAPGSGIYSTYIDGYGWMSGTSMASPVVAGVVALILSANPNLTVNEVKDILYGTAVDLGTPGRDVYYGYGRVDARAAAAAAAGSITPEVPADTMEVTAAANGSYGTVSGGGTYNPGDSVTLSATPYSGYRFMRWMDGTTLLSASSIYVFTARESCIITAEFAAIGTPSISAAASGYSGAAVSWNAVSGVTRYEVWRSTSADSGYAMIAAVTATLYSDTGLVSGATYYFKVKACCVALTATTYGSLSAYASVALPLQAPVGVSAVPGSYQSITVSWNAVEGASGYQVYRATSENGSYSMFKTTTSTSYINTSLKTGTTYYYKVRAYKTSGKTKTYGEFSGAVSAAPILSSVATAGAVAYSPTSIKVSWSAVPGRTKYEVWRAQEGGEYTLVKTTTSTYWKDTTRTPFVTYCYYIRVYRSVSGQKVYASSASPTVSAVPILADVTGVNAAGSSTGITVKWSSVSGASGYEVWRSDTADGEYMRIKSTPSKSYTDKDVVPNRTYYYKVQAYRAVNGVRYCSAPTIVSAAGYLGPVTNAKAVRSSSTKIKLTWSAVSGRTGYEIYRSEAPDGEFVSIGTTTRTSYYSSGLTTGTPYYYKICAYKAVNGVRYYSEELASVTAVSATP